MSTRSSAASNPLSSTLKVPEGAEVATLAAGCFWGVEHMYRKHFGSGRGLIDCRVGYTGGAVDLPTYREVCSGSTGHAEAIQISFDPTIVNYETLLDFFFRMHDPTTQDRQGPDRGSQYRSAIFTHNQQQFDLATQVKERMQTQFYPKNPIATKIVPIHTWWDAEVYHQLYLEKNPSGYECPSHFLRTKPMV
ncbi:peptide methionine sulfoxide reductase [Nadsonia fulvescens var. elongata DSM 6958]|uniref:peptide-methionine (S)-S-oxide reductase n=1 Tax=Nadsonia fulvescens var. elongata DSM 6958 TaxID=857566 RepID=A0A1E3PIW4_9ASCO|nr:peptide methionine sulfoxide reductase [Nadsonia fulvescens var. elongata DSM 6958]